MKDNMTLSNLIGGGVEEEFQAVLQRVLDNIKDPNTKAKLKRSITVKLDFAPIEKRTLTTVASTVTCKLAPSEAIETEVAIERGKDGLVARELYGENPEQHTLPGAFDEETGEIFDDDALPENVTQLHGVASNG